MSEDIRCFDDYKLPRPCPRCGHGQCANSGSTSMLEAPMTEQTKTVSYDSDPQLSDDEWCKRFVEHMVKRVAPFVGKSDDEDDEDAWQSVDEVREYAAEVAAPSYLQDRHEYTDPEEAADTDISYWD